jgi:hypothetical protein
MKCRKCKNILFTIQIIPCCGDCSENSAYDPEKEEYIDNDKIINEFEMIRDHVEHEGECNFGTAFGAGCYMFTCNKCNAKINLAVSDSCG